MSRSVFTGIIKRAFARASNHDRTRREFIRKSVMATAALTLPVGCFSKRAPSIAIIGAGIGGLTAGYHLKKSGVNFTIYEATGRSGGRVLTVPGAVIENSHVDFGAEFVDTTHAEVLQLAKELNVPLHDLRDDKLQAKTFFFGGRHINEEQLVTELQPFANQLADDLLSLPDELHYSNAEALARIDGMSITAYLNAIGMKGWLFDFFEMATTAEYAMEASEQSAINLLIMLSTPIEYDEHYHLFGQHHEVLKFKQGSASLTEALAKQVEQQVKYGWQLKSIDVVDGKYKLGFEGDGKQQIVEADLIVLAIPFPVLRDVTMNFKFPERKQKCIDTVGFGNGAKVAMGFKKRVWRELGYQGYTFTDVNRTVIWDSAQVSDSTEGSLTFVGGGKISDEFFQKSYADIQAQWLDGADRIFHGLKAEFNGKISKFCWAVNPFAKGSYTSYKVGQWSVFAGVESEPFNNIYFAGEHCNVAFQGYMNGAALSGKKAGEEIVKKLMIV